MSRLWDATSPGKRAVMLAPFDYVLATVAGSRRRYGVQRFRSLFPLRVRMHPDLYLVVRQHPLVTNNTILTDEGSLIVAPDDKLPRDRLDLDVRYGQ